MLRVARPAVSRAMSMLVVSFVVSTANAGEAWESAEHRCSVVLPHGWSVVPPPYPNSAAIMAARSVDTTKSITLGAMPANGVTKVGEEFDRGFLKSAGNGAKIATSDSTHEGRPAHRITATTTINGQSVSIVSVTMYSRGRLYSMGATSLMTDADKDAELNACLASLHFVDPPDVPSEPPDNRDWSLRASEKIGEFVGVMIIIIVGVYVVGRFKG